MNRRQAQRWVATHRVTSVGIAMGVVLLTVTCGTTGGARQFVRRILRRSAPDAGPPPPAADSLALGRPDARVLPERYECRFDEDCRRGRHDQGRCYSRALFAQYTQAFRDCADGRLWRDTHVVGTCVFDECHDRAGGGDDCPPGQRCAMLEMVSFPQRVCIPSRCAGDRDCRHAGLGTCAAYLAGGRCIRGGWSCSYPRDPCAPRDALRLCPVRAGLVSFCAPRDGRFECIEESAILPDVPGARAVLPPRIDASASRSVDAALGDDVVRAAAPGVSATASPSANSAAAATRDRDGRGGSSATAP